jgi:hypothetical protein
MAKGFCKKTAAQKTVDMDFIREEAARSLSREHGTPIEEARKAFAHFPYIYKVKGSYVGSMEPISPETLKLRTRKNG